MPPTDAERALRILHDTFWSSSGWKDSYRTPHADLAFAKSQGCMFDAKHMPRRTVIADLVNARRAVTVAQVADAFVGSLSGRALAQRSALASFAFARHMPPHDCVKHDNTHRSCSICGEEEPRASWLEDLNVLNFERHKWGGVRHRDPIYAGLDLQLFAKMTPHGPDDADREILAAILNAASSLPLNARPGHLEKAIASSFPSNKPEREQLVQVLGISGVLEPAKHPSYRTAFVDPFSAGNAIRNEWGYPTGQWRGSDGVNAAAVAEWFPWAKLRKGKWTC